MLVLQLQQLDVLQLQQLEHEQLELHQSMTMLSIASTSSISNVSLSSPRSSSVSSGMWFTSPPGIRGVAGGGRLWHSHPHGQLVLLQLDDVQLQQLDVLQLEQLDVLVLLLQISITSAESSAMSSISNVSICRSRSSPRSDADSAASGSRSVATDALLSIGGGTGGAVPPSVWEARTMLAGRASASGLINYGNARAGASLKAGLCPVSAAARGAGAAARAARRATAAAARARGAAAAQRQHHVAVLLDLLDLEGLRFELTKLVVQHDRHISPSFPSACLRMHDREGG
ncbi:MAG TPA: hypothetical protein VF174_09715 [Micromonosporaceae bacterium]